MTETETEIDADVDADADIPDSGSPGYADPTPIEIWRRRIEVHRMRGEHGIADAMQDAGRPARQKPRGRDDDGDNDNGDPRLIPIQALKISDHLRGRLESHGLHFVGEFAGFTAEQVLAIPNLGPVMFRELMAALKKLGISLRDS